MRGLKNFIREVAFDNVVYDLATASAISEARQRELFILHCKCIGSFAVRGAAYHLYLRYGWEFD